MPKDLPVHGGIIGVRVEAKQDTVYVVEILPGSPAASAGLRRHDQLLAAASYRFNGTREFIRYIKSLRPDTTVVLTVRRGNKETQISVSVTDIRRLFATMSEGNIRVEADQPQHDTWSKREDRLEQAARRLANGRASEQWQYFRNSLKAKLGNFGADMRLKDVHFALHNPLKGSQIASNLADALSAANSLQQMLLQASLHSDIEMGMEVLPEYVSSNSLEEFLLSRLSLASHYVSLAFDGNAFRSHLLREGLTLLDSFARSPSPPNRRNRNAYPRNDSTG